MNVEINRADSSFNESSLDIETLEKNVETFSYSSYVRYLLLLNCKKSGHADFEKEAKKTALYFNNAQWLQFQLSQIETGVHNDAHDSYSDINHFAVLTEEQIEIAKNAEEKSDDFLNGNDIQREEVLTASENILENKGQNIFEIVPGQNEIISAEVFQPGADNVEAQAIRINSVSNANDEETPVADVETIAVSKRGINEEETFDNNDKPIENLAVDDIEKPRTEVMEQAISLQLDVKKDYENNADNEPLLIPGNKTLESVVTNEDVIAFEPLHTVDYFASQGIKITDEVFTNDKLGTQMKSFTEWLRSMKKLPNAKIPQQNSLAEHIIQSAAESSNIDTEVLTEAMAEVLIKQDKREKAIEMYNKLSLINPSKSAYFAAKIESIKST